MYVRPRPTTILVVLLLMYVYVLLQIFWWTFSPPTDSVLSVLYKISQFWSDGLMSAADLLTMAKFELCNGVINGRVVTIKVRNYGMQISQRVVRIGPQGSQRKLH